MEQARHFLESSTIHGLYHISSSRKCSRLFWIVIVIGGFTGAAYQIWASFNNWNLSPIVTTIETRPISELKLPNITVCPPKVSFLNLNYDFKASKNVALHNTTRTTLIDAFLDLFQDTYFKEKMRTLNKIHDSDRYYNWYHGFTKLQYPVYLGTSNFLSYPIDTTTTSGNISTQYFGEKFNIDKIDLNMDIIISIKVPEVARYVDNILLMINMEKMPLFGFPDSQKISLNRKDLAANITPYKVNITASNNYAYVFLLRRIISKEDISSVEQNQMPGLRLTWSYQPEIDNISKYIQDDDISINKEFIR